MEIINHFLGIIKGIVRTFIGIPIRYIVLFISDYKEILFIILLVISFFFLLLLIKNKNEWKK